MGRNHDDSMRTCFQKLLILEGFPFPFLLGAPAALFARNAATSPCPSRDLLSPLPFPVISSRFILLSPELFELLDILDDAAS